MNLHSIDIAGGYSGTVQVTIGKLHVEFGETLDEFSEFRGFSSDIKSYYFCLLTPERKNIEFYLLRFLNGEWCMTKSMYPSFPREVNEKLINGAKSTIWKMGL